MSVQTVVVQAARQAAPKILSVAVIQGLWSISQRLEKRLDDWQQKDAPQWVKDYMPVTWFPKVICGALAVGAVLKINAPAAGEPAPVAAGGGVVETEKWGALDVLKGQSPELDKLVKAARADEAQKAAGKMVVWKGATVPNDQVAALDGIWKGAGQEATDKFQATMTNWRGATVPKDQVGKLDVLWDAAQQASDGLVAGLRQQLAQAQQAAQAVVAVVQEDLASVRGKVVAAFNALVTKFGIHGGPAELNYSLEDVHLVVKKIGDNKYSIEKIVE